MNYLKKAIQSDNPLEYLRQIICPYSHKKLIKHITNCSDCVGASNKSLPYGNPDANILIINGNATESEEASSFFDELLTESGIYRDDIYVINSVNCTFKRVDGSDRLPTEQEKCNCRYFVDYAIDFVKPRIIIAMGSTIINSYYPGFSLLKDDEKYGYIHNIKTVITDSVSELERMSNYLPEEELDKKIQEVYNAFVYAKEYLEEIGDD